ncbi:hypothetical protein PIB30_032132 [Stylosanthes scabra]|uniref:HTH myb-type domain-containing protein n=1 Tax=Stylosanthes scabra TaxID=79078 RepID=A0ABU6WDB5_9FABA|nr:hypothetical protein [Stylosanthes scabra]
MPRKASSLHKMKPIQWNHRMPQRNEKPGPQLEPKPVPAPAPAPVLEPIPVPVSAPAPTVTTAPAPEAAPLDSEGEGVIPSPSPPSSITSSSKRRKRKSSEMSNSEGESSGTKHKKKVIWTNSLHSLFLVAIRHIGLDKAVPKKILEIMNVPNLTRENIASHLQKYRIFLRKVAEKGILEGLSERTLRSRFAADLPIDLIREMQASIQKLNNTKIFLPTTPLIRALLGRNYPLYYNYPANNNGVRPTYPAPTTSMYPQNYAQPPPMGINNNNNLQNQRYGGPMMYNYHQSYGQPPMGNNNYHQSYDLGMGNMVSMGNPNNNNNMALMNAAAAAPSYYPNYNFGGEILGVRGHGGFNNNDNSSNVNGFGFNGNYPAMVQGYYAPPPPAAAVNNNYSSGGSCNSESSVTSTVSAGSNEDQPIQVDDYVLSNLYFMMEDMRLLAESEQAAKNQEGNNAFFMPASSYTSSNVIMQSPQQVGGNQVPDDFFDFSGSAIVMQQTQISGDLIVPSAANNMNLPTEIPITTNDYIPIQASIYNTTFY